MQIEIQEIISKLSNSSARMLTGFRKNTLEILNQQEILRIYAQSGKVLAATTSANTPCVFGCMNWNNGWTQHALYGFPIRK